MRGHLLVMDDRGSPSLSWVVHDGSAAVSEHELFTVEPLLQTPLGQLKVS